MSVQTVSDDLLSILRRFTSPTMGPFANTNATPPMPPPGSLQAGSDDARMQSDPARYGGGEQPMQPGFPRGGIPQPVSRRVVPDVETTGAVTPRAAPLPPAAAAAAPAAAPVASDVPDFVASDPAYQAWRAQQDKLIAEAKRQQALDNIVGGIAQIGGAATGDETLMKTGAAAGTGTKLPSTALTLDQFDAFRKRADALKDEAEEKQRVDRIVADPRMKGVTRDVLYSLRANDPKKYAELLKDYFDGQTQTFTDSDGNVWSRPLRGAPDAKPTLILGDPSKAAANAAELEAKQAGTTKTRVETQKATQDLLDAEKLYQPDNLAKIAEITGIDATTLATMPPNAIVDAITKIRTSAESQAGGERLKISGKRVEDAQKTITTAQTNIAERAMRRGVLERGGVITGYPGAEFEGQVRAFVSGGMDEKEARTRAYLALSAADVLRAGADMKGAFSEKDREFLEAARGGSRALSQPEMQRLLALHDLIDRKQLNRAIGERSKGRKAIDQDDSDADEDRAGALQRHELKVARSDLVREALSTTGGRKYLDTVYGKDTAQELVDRAEEVAASKIGPEIDTFRTKKVEQLEAARDDLNRAMIAKYGDDADGAIDIIIAQRKRGGR